MTDRPTTSITTARVLAGVSTDVLLALARERAFDPEVLTERSPFFWLNEISSDRMDSYFGFMDAATTLVNFAADAAEGRAFLAGHNTRSLPFGYTLTGSLERGDVSRVLADAYTLRGLDLSGVSTNSFIDGVRAGVIRDVSVGFTLGDSGWYRCNACGNDLYDWERCRHWPGATYETKGEDGVIRTVLATFTVIDARLSEVSSVYDGATPSAGILKAQTGARLGLLDDRTRTLLEQRYRCSLPDRMIRITGVDLPVTAHPKELTMTDDEIRDVLNLPADVDPREALTTLAAEIPTLRRDAEAGRAARERLIADALSEAVRAHGADAYDRYAPVLARLDLETIRTMQTDWATIAKERLPGGRVTTDGLATDPPARPAPEPPADVYRAG